MRKGKYPNRASARIILTTRDLELLKFLWDMKLASLDQIKKRFYSDTGMHTAQRRLLKLLRATYIRKLELITEKFGLKSIYSISKKGENLCKKLDDYFINQNKAASQAPLHDLALVDLREALELRFSEVYFWSENALSHLGSRHQRHRGLEALARSHSDAGLSINGQFDEQELVIGIEYEAQQKSQDRIRGRIATYHSEEKVQAVLCFAASKEIIRTMQNAEKKYIKSQPPKFYFSRYEEFISPKAECVFENCFRQKFKLKFAKGILNWTQI